MPLSSTGTSKPHSHPASPSVQALSSHQDVERQRETSMDFTFPMIEQITKNFSEDLKIGRGGYGEVYRGVHNGKEIAIKKLFPLQALDDNEFISESLNLMKVQHENVVRLVGYCHESRMRHVEHNGKLVFATITERVLCLEYLPGGTLANYLTDESCGLEWSERYKIIKGTCEGLNYLHNGLKDRIYHLDLKPENILLDKNMMPKIADFGLSRLFASSRTHITQTFKGTEGYMPPEYIERRRITKKFDVFSLGVIIIKTIAGPKAYNDHFDISPPQKFIELVQVNWNKRLQAAGWHTSHKIDMLGVTKCIEIALRCVEREPEKRPAIIDIIEELKELETQINKLLIQESRNNSRSLAHQTSSDSLYLGVDPAIELRFPFELHRDISCCLQLTNKSSDFVAFKITTNQNKYRAKPNKRSIPPYSKCYVTVTMRARQRAPQNMQCRDMFVVQSTRVTEEIASDDITEDFFRQVMEENGVDEVKLPIVYVPLDQPPC